MRCLVLHHHAEGAARLAAHFTDATCLAEHPGEEWDVLIRWGNASGPDAPVTLNRAIALRQLFDRPEAVGEILRANRLPFREGMEDPYPYRVHVVDLQVIAITRRDRQGRFRVASRVHRRRRLVLEHLARRAVYLAGLHFGAVDIAVGASDKPLIIAVSPTPGPGISEQGLAQYATAILRTARLLDDEARIDPLARSSQILMGADPEFLLLHRHSRRLRFASDYFPPGGPVGYDARTVRSRRGRRHPIAEVHPEPSPDPRELVARIRRNLQYATRLVPDPNALWLAGACPHSYFPIGGHIHLSRVPLNTDLLRALDNYLAIPMLLLEEPRTACRRRVRHGFLGDFRLKEHGGFEYRTLSSWITGASRARATLCLAKLVALEYPRLRSDYLLTPESQLAFYRSDKAYFRALFPRLWSEIAATETFQHFQHELTPLCEWIEARRRWRDDVDIRRRWALPRR